MADAAPSVQNFFKQKIAGVPVWLIVGGVGAVGVGVFVYLKNQKSTTSAATNPNAAGAAAGTATSAPPIYVSTPPATASSGTSTTDTGTGTTTTSTGTTGGQTVTLGPAPGQANAGIWSQDVAVYNSASTTGAYQTIPFGSYTLSGPPQNNLYPISGPGGGTVWALAENVSGVSGSGGMGGRGAPSTTPWETFTQRNHVPSYWAATGMGGGSISGLADQLGIPHERLQALNPMHKAKGYRVNPGDLIHVH
jgi:hypothetical protein